jgi:hypothetical protein
METILIFCYSNKFLNNVTIFNFYCRWDYIQIGNKIVKDMDRMQAFRYGLTTWANWVNTQVDTRKTKVLSQGISPTHFK